MRQTVFVIVIVGALSATAAAAQVASLNADAFEAASIKESSSLEGDGVFRINPGRFSVVNLSLTSILRWAFNVRAYQLVGAPAWADTRYQIEATYVRQNATAADVRRMLQRLLADRFGLRVHREPRAIPVYALVAARDTRQLGPQLTRSATDCSQPAPPATDGARPQPRCVIFAGASVIRGFARTMPQLAERLEEIVGAPVLDRTELQGVFDFDLRWGTEGTRDPSIQSPEDLASLFTALQEQLGLKLQSTHGQYDVVVVDSVARPTAN